MPLQTVRPIKINRPVRSDLLLYIITSVIIGVFAWAIPVIQICSSENSQRKWKYTTLLSMGLCSVSIYVQILLMKSYGDEWILIVDSLGALKTAAPILIVVTVILNLIAIMKTKD